jgi:hypothetical protein
MSPEEYMETIIESMMIGGKTGLPEDDEIFFKVKARTHNTEIPDAEIERFWKENSHRLSS